MGKQSIQQQVSLSGLLLRRHRVFPQNFQANDGVLPRFGYERFLLYPLEFINHRANLLNTEIVVK